MKILWTISNWKRTGPVEPSLDLAAALQAEGHDVHVAVGRHPRGHEDHAGASAAARGLARANTGARLAKHSSPLRDRRDARRLRQWIERERPDAIVCTLRGDHVLACRAAEGVGTPVARLWFGDGAGPLDPRDVKALATSACAMVFSGAAAGRLEDSGVPASKLVPSGPPLDLEALRAHVGDVAAVRRGLGLEGGELLVGIVARMQRHRRFEMLWESVVRLAGDAAPIHVLVVGRGTYEESVGREPVRSLGLERQVTFAGYLRGQAYATTLAACDVQLLLVPGSDPTCRALREGMALGVASVTTRRGMLPELVVDGETGLLVDEAPEALAAALKRLSSDRSAVARMGAAAREHADREFDARQAARRLLEALGGRRS